jgi:hypothetical protein
MNSQQYNTVRAGANVVFAAPSGKTYEAIVLETDWIGHEVNLLVEFSFTWSGRVVRSTGWQPFSSIRVIEPADVCPSCGDKGYVSIHGDEARECPLCNPVEMEITF